MPCHEIMVPFILPKLILQTHKHSRATGQDLWFLVGPFAYFCSSCVWTAKALASLRISAGSPEPSLVAFVISTIISWAGSFISVKPKLIGVGDGSYWNILIIRLLFTTLEESASQRQCEAQNYVAFNNILVLSQWCLFTTASSVVIFMVSLVMRKPVLWHM